VQALVRDERSKAPRAPEDRYQMAKSTAIEVAGDNKLSTIKAWPQRIKSFYNDVRT
jgi:hypothetical protein